MRGRLLRILCGALLVLPLAVVASPPAVASHSSDLTYACAAKKSGILRYAHSPADCGKNETLITFSVADPVMMCISPDGSVRKIARVGSCKKLNGTVITIPSNTANYFCVDLSSSRLLRWVATAECPLGETLFTSVNHAPTDIALSNDSVEENVPTGTVVGNLTASDPDVGDTASFSLVSGTGDADNGSFSIIGDQLSTAAAIDFETQASYSIRIGVTDHLAASYEEVFTITVNDVVENLAPTDISLSHSSVAENQPTGTTIGTLTTTDPDAGDSHTYMIVTGGDGASFQIAGATLQTNAVLDFENDSSLQVTIRTDDGHLGTYDETFTVTVTDGNDPPTSVALSNDSVAENQPTGTSVGILTATDQDPGDSFSFSLVTGSGDDDNASFQIVGQSLRTNASFDFETDSVLSVRVRADDGAGGTFEQAIGVTVTDANDAPTDISLDPSSVTEGQPAGTTIGSLDAADQDPGETFTFTEVAGAGDEDNAKVTIDGTTLKTAAVIDYATDSVLHIRVQVSDGSATYEEALTVTVVNVNTAPTDLALSNASVAENQPSGTTVGTLSSSDEPGDTHSYALVSGTGSADNGSFQITGDTLSTNASFDFETKSSYTIRVRSTDQDGASFEKVLLVTISDANDAPTDVTLNNASVNENEPSATTVGSLFAVDVDAGDTHTFSLVSGTGDADNASFSITGNTLKTAVSFNFEVKDSYSVRIRATDSGGATFEKAFTITILDVNDAPTVVADSYSGAIGNTLAVLGVAGAGPHVVLTGSLPLANDSDEDADPITAVVETVASTGGGSASISADGSFTFLPGVGDKSQTDTFTYHVTDGLATSAGTISVGIGADLVWYVNASAAAGDGRSSAPFNTLTGVNGAGGSGDSDGTGDWIFLYGGSYSGGLPLETSQNLYGQPAGLTIGTHALVAAAGSNPVIGNAGGVGIGLANGVAVRAVNVSGTSGAGIAGVSLTNATVGGSPGGTTTVSGASGAAISLTGAASGTVSFETNVSNTTGASVVVSGRSGGSVALHGSITDTGSGITLSGNTGASITFDGGLTLSPATSSAFSATGGGTVAVTGPGNTLSTSTSAALTVTNTTIGASGLTFRSISSHGSPTAISLTNTGTSGGLTVTGNSSGTCGGVITETGGLTSGPQVADCTGGSITDTMGTAVLLNQTHAVSLTRVRIENSGGDGIGGTSLTGGFSLVNSVVTGSGDAGEENGIDLGDSAAITPQGVTGTVAINHSTITGSADSNVLLNNSSGTASVVLDHNRIANADSAVGNTQENIQVEASSSAVIALTIDANSLAAAKGDQVQVNAANGAGGGGSFTSATISDNTMSGGAAGALAQGITISAAGQAPLWAGSVTYDINANIINGAVTHAVTVSLGASAAGPRFSGFVRNNVIGTTGQALSCSTQGNGIFSKAEGSGTSTIAIQGNTIRRCFDRGIEVTGRDGNGVLNATVSGNTVTEMSDTNNVTATPREAFLMVAGSTSTNIVGGIDSHTVCLALSGNNLTGGAHKTGDIRTRQRFQTHVTLPGYAGTAFDTTAVQNFLSGANGGATATATANDDGTVNNDGYFGGGACATPAGP